MVLGLEESEGEQLGLLVGLVAPGAEPVEQELAPVVELVPGLAPTEKPVPAMELVGERGRALG